MPRLISYQFPSISFHYSEGRLFDHSGTETFFKRFKGRVFVRNNATHTVTSISNLIMSLFGLV